MNKEQFALPGKTEHLMQMIDSTGILQHAIYCVPNLSEGYTSDDNARGLIMAVMLHDYCRAKKAEKWILTFSAFLFYAQNHNGTFRNFMGYNRVFLEKKGSEDSFGRCMWGLCHAYMQTDICQSARKAIWKRIALALPNCKKIIAPRAKAYTLLGLTLLPTQVSAKYATLLAESLADQYEHFIEPDWHWFEDNVTYCNSVLPLALLRAGKMTGNERYTEIAFESMQFLEEITFRETFYAPIGCNGWYEKGGEPAKYDEQPVEACEATLLYLEAYDIKHEEKYMQKAKMALSWYRGNNSAGLSMIDPETGGCYDGIEVDGLNHNQGAESVVSYWIAALAMKMHEDKKEES